MKANNILISLAFLLPFLFNACSSEAQNQEEISSDVDLSGIEIIQFHSEHRCMTCKKIESLARQTVKNYEIPFYLVNAEAEKNEKKVQEFEAFGTALFIYQPESGKKKDLTDFAFMNAGNEEKFTSGLQKEIVEFVE